MMYLINNQPVIDFSPYVDLDSLLKLKPYLDYAVVKSSMIVTPSRYFKYQFLNQTAEGLSDILDSYVGDKLKEFPFLEELKSTDQLASWLRYHKELVYGQQSVQIIYPTSWETKHLANTCIKTDNIKYFQPLFDWVNQQNIFSEYGRVVVFLNEPQVPTPIHHDGYTKGKTSKDQFVWVGLDYRKKFFVYDADSNTKHYLQSPIGLFDTANYHGADPSEFATWSLRIDGVFSDLFLEKTDLTKHFR